MALFKPPLALKIAVAPIETSEDTFLEIKRGDIARLFNEKPPLRGAKRRLLT